MALIALSRTKFVKLAVADKATHTRTKAVVRTRARACTATAASTLTTFRQIRPRGKMVSVRATVTENRPKPADSDKGTRDEASPNGFHLHFGGGRLGFGLVFPALVASNVPFAVMQPPFAEFAPILESGNARVKVTINNSEAIETGLRIVTEADDVSDLHEKVGGSLVLINEGEKWVHLIGKATSFSCSIGPKVAQIIGPVLLANIPERPLYEQPILYGCENDHGAVKQLAAVLEGRVRVVPCMVDRICSDRLIQAEQIVVTTEPWEGTIIPLTPLDTLIDPQGVVPSMPIPLGGEVVFMPRTKEIADYRYTRKLYFVNHMHTTLALMTLARYRQEKHISTEALLEGDGACIPLPLVNPDKMPMYQKMELKAWMVAQILMLMKEYEADIVMEAHDVSNIDDLSRSLVEVATQRSARFATVYDTCDRVLGAGVACRFEGRLVPAYKAVEEMLSQVDEWPEDSPQNRVLYHSGLSLYDVYWALKRMVSEGEEIAATDLQKRSGPEDDDHGEVRQAWMEDSMDDLKGALDWLVCSVLHLK
eukprot:CAMPEP_0198199724 /NCGR_PEP_ID=MMETSP1445-20131203/2914_1 /TAXON_ID=36898 /ORGANISM="Pyramimonas sp., Strain CCMP2087" /LENGTH=536 /DNA_ID=CAMNT_0043869615 /DNA_START=110 /DNA_END=1720 /DNA_ORIENTATION=-